jgi:L-seryl-tRNA(Ser) seleniumtransferase
LTGAEAATVVNNCAAAVYLILYTLARRREVITSRGELVEIGGNFRVPDVVRASGCKLVEVGSTNRTRLADYSEAITERTALLLKTHPSNYRIRGFTEEAGIAELAGLARERGLPLVLDAGSGLLNERTAAQLPEGSAEAQTLPGGLPLNEPSISAAVAAGASLVCFSGDKLLGGPQAGIICGEAALIARLRKSPLWRALRVDKLTIAALGATLAEQLRLPQRRSGGGMDLLYSQLAPADQRTKAEQLQRVLLAAAPDWAYELIELDGGFGGGSSPDEPVPGWAVAIQARHLSAEELQYHFRAQDFQPVLGLMHRGRCCLHVAALLPGDVEAIAEAVRRIAPHDQKLPPIGRQRGAAQPTESSP